MKTGESENPHGDKGFSQFPQSFPHFPVETVVAGGGSVEKSAGKNGQKKNFLAGFGCHAILQHVAHAAEGAAVLGHEYIVYGDGANIFSHGKNLPIRCSTNFVHKYTFWVFRGKQAALWGPFVKTRRKTRGFAASIPQNRGIA